MTRYLLDALGEKVSKVVGFSTLLVPKLGPVDKLDAIWQLSNGCQGSFNRSFGTEYKSAFEVEMVTDKGSILVKPTEVAILTKDASGEKSSSCSELEMTNGVKEEMITFAQAILTDSLDRRLSAEEALEDLNVLENMLSSNGLAKDL
jgi:predicted dehydrogenase